MYIFLNISNESKYVSGYDVDLQVTTPEYIRQKFGFNANDRVFSYISLELQLKEEETLVVYPKISEIFA